MTNTARYDDNYDDSWDDPDERYETAIDEEFYDEDFEEAEAFDCGFIPGDGCQLAGTEDCDWECPYRRALEKHPDYPNCSILGTDLMPEPLLETDTLVETPPGVYLLPQLIIVLLAAYEPETWLSVPPVERYEILAHTERLIRTQAEGLGADAIAALQTKRQQAIALIREQVCRDANPSNERSTVDLTQAEQP